MGREQLIKNSPTNVALIGLALLALPLSIFPRLSHASANIDVIFADGYRLGRALAHAVGPKAQEIVKWSTFQGHQIYSPEVLTRDMSAFIDDAVRTRPALFTRQLAQEYGEEMAPQILARLRTISLTGVPIRGPLAENNMMSVLVRSIGANARILSAAEYAAASARVAAEVAVETSQKAQVEQLVAALQEFTRQAGPSARQIAAPAVTTGVATYTSVTTGTVSSTTITGTAAAVGTFAIGTAVVLGPPAAVYYTLKQSKRGLAFDVARRMYGEKAAEQAVTDGYIHDASYKAH